MKQQQEILKKAKGKCKSNFFQNLHNKFKKKNAYERYIFKIKNFKFEALLMVN